MPIAVDSTASAVDNGVASSINWSHTISASSCLLIVATACLQQEFGQASNVLWGAVGLTARTLATGGSTITLELWTLTSPTTGTQTLTVNYNNGVPNRSAVSIALSGVDTTSPIASTRAFSGGSGASFSTEHVSGSGDLVVDSIFVTGGVDNSSLTAGSSQTEVNHTSANTVYSISMSYKTASGSSLQTAMSWSWDGSRQFGYGGMAIADQVAASIKGNPLIWMQ